MGGFGKPNFASHWLSRTCSLGLATPYTIKLLDQNANLLLAVETSLVPDVNLNEHLNPAERGL